MRYIKIIRIISVIMIASILCGCGQTDELMLYSAKGAKLSDVASIAAGNSLYLSKAYNESVCVIPESQVNQDIDDNLTASGILNIDVTDNKVLCAKGIYDRLYPASLTKLGTALVCFKYGNMQDTVTVSYTASHLNVPGAKLCFLQEGDVINFETLLTSFLVYSGNDAGIALAEHISGSEKEFVKLMNKELKKIGAVDTHFVNSHGLPDDKHYTTPYDIYLMLNELARYDKFLEITSMESYTADFVDKSGNPVRKVYETTDKYLTGEAALPKGVTILAGKTGTTTAAGYCLAVLSEKKKTSHRYISVVMKAYSSDSLYSQMTNLLKQK